MTRTLAELIAEQTVIVCAGAGGVGKTSISCALALAAARLGRRVLAVTIDPSRRLAEALGVQPHSPEPIRLSPTTLAAAGVEPPGRLDAWMLDPQLVSDNVVRRFAKTTAEADELLNNRMYRNITAMVAGMQEYTAVEALYEFVTEGRYDLVILDTPPSRNALHFLDAPSRITRFLDGLVFRFFLPSAENDGVAKRVATKITEKIMDVAFGHDTRTELMVFFALFSAILHRLSHNAAEMQDFFRRPEVSFLIVTSPAREALDEAAFLEHRARKELGLPLNGFVLNRSLAFGDRFFPDDEFFAESHVPESARTKLRALAAREAELVASHQQVLVNLAGRVDNDCFAHAAPYIEEGVSDVPTLMRLADALVAPIP